MLEINKLIEITVNETGGILSGELASLLVKEFNLTVDNARQLICRLEKPYLKLKLGFKNNQSFIFSESVDMKKCYKTLLMNLKEHSKAYYEVIIAIINNYGFFNKNQICNYLSSPIEEIKGHKTAMEIIDDLLKNGIIVEVRGELLQLNHNFIDLKAFNTNYSSYKGNEIKKVMVSNRFSNFVRFSNMCSFDSGKTIRENPNFASFQWSFSAPSYINGIKKKTKQNKDIISCFIAGDIFFINTNNHGYLDYYLKKIEIINMSKNSQPYLPYLIYEYIPEQQFKALKESGIILINIKEIFGETLANQLEILDKIFYDYKANIAQFYDYYKFQIVEELAPYFKSDKTIFLELTEYLFALYYYKKGYDINRINEVVMVGEESIIIDLCIEKEEEVVIFCIEGRKEKLKKIEFENWKLNYYTKLVQWINENKEFVNKKVSVVFISILGQEEDFDLCLDELGVALFTKDNFEELLLDIDGESNNLDEMFKEFM